MARKCYIKDLKIKLQEKSRKSWKLNLVKNYRTMIKKAFFLHSNLLDGSLSLSLLLVVLGNLSALTLPQQPHTVLK